MKRSILTAFLPMILLIGYACVPGGNREETWVYDAEQYERVNIDYNVKGRGDTTLVFIHGWNINQTYWDYPIKYLADEYKIVTLDLAGHGKSSSDRTNWTAESFARDIVSVIEKDSLQNIILIGHSIGGEIALQVNAIVPLKIIGIIGVDSFKDVSFKLTENYKKEFSSYLDKFKRNYTEMADQYARDNMRTDNRDVINQILKDYKDADPKIAIAILKNMVFKYEQDKELLQRLNFPLHVIASDYAPFNEEALAKYAKSGYSLTWLEDAGHFPMVEQPVAFLNALQSSLQLIVNPHDSSSMKPTAL